MSKNNKKGFTLVNVVTFILLLLLIIGVAGAIVNLLISSMGVYVEYDGKIITSDNDGITINCTESETATFTIKSSDWGVYSVEDCKVTVINNVNSSYDFEYSADGETYLFSYTTDFTSLFSEDGGGITVNADGEFTLYFNYLDMQSLLNAYTGADVAIDGKPDIGSYPYFAINIVPSDGSSTITIPFVITYDGIKLKLSFDSIAF